MSTLLERPRIETPQPSRALPSPPRRRWLTTVIVVAALIGVALGITSYRILENGRADALLEARNEAYATGMRDLWISQNVDPLAVQAARSAATVAYYNARWDADQLAARSAAYARAEATVAHYTALAAEQQRQADARDTIAGQRVAWYEADYAERLAYAQAVAEARAAAIVEHYEDTFDG